MKISFLGAAGTVTGSSYLVETDKVRLLIDFGLFQGGAKEEALNCLPPELDAEHLDAVLVTHGHLDHTGRLPLLTKHGFAGRIYSTAATRDLSSLILHDSAKIQAADIARVNRKRERADQPPLVPMYEQTDVDAVMTRFSPVAFDALNTVASGVEARFVEAGHMLGSASIELTVTEGGKRKIVVFSGDLGPRGMAVIRDYVPLQKADAVFMESTYGDRDHRPMADTLEEFRVLVERTARSGCKLLVPAFAIGRTQQMLYHLEEIYAKGLIKPFPVYLDSPMAIAATGVYLKYPDLYDDEMKELDRRTGMIQHHENIKAVESPMESMALNNISGPCLIMAGSGMCTAGRILHHLRHNLWKRETLVAIVGFQAQGTLGRMLVDHARSVTIFGERVAVNAEIHTLNGFSAHAGQSDLLEWFSHLAGSRPRVFLTHGEAPGRLALSAKLQELHKITPEMPSLGDSVTL
jgi:metallo-beta-lactamase family protein